MAIPESLARKLRADRSAPRRPQDQDVLPLLQEGSVLEGMNHLDFRVQGPKDLKGHGNPGQDPRRLGEDSRLGHPVLGDHGAGGDVLLSLEILIQGRSDGFPDNLFR